MPTPVVIHFQLLFKHGIYFSHSLQLMLPFSTLLAISSYIKWNRPGKGGLHITFISVFKTGKVTATSSAVSKDTINFSLRNTSTSAQHLVKF